jgi:toxin ParE1/3/4
MSNYILSGEADADLVEIYQFSYDNFGESRADAYLLGLEEKFNIIATNKDAGRSISHIRQGYFRYDYTRHSIFYKYENSKTVLIVRVLHNSMEHENHL